MPGALEVDAERTVNERMHIRCGFCVKIFHVVIVFRKVLAGRWERYSMRRRKGGRLHRKRRFYDPKDGENITCVAKAHTLRAAPRSTLVLHIYIYMYIDIQRFLRLAATDAPFKCVYTHSSRVCVRVNSIVFTALTIRIKTLKRYSFRLVLPPPTHRGT